MSSGAPEARLPRRRGLFRPQVVPTLLTLGNLFFGFLAVSYAADALAIPREMGKEGDHTRLALLEAAGWVIFLGMVCDALDGSVARLSGGTSAFGAQLDSLADIVTFGVAPALLAKVMAEGVGGMGDRKVSLFFSVFFALMAGLRLARYNVQHGDPEEAQLWFQGLPTPGAAGVIAGIAVVLPSLNSDAWFDRALLRALPWLTLALGVLMVSRLPFPHFANRFLRGRKPVTFVVWVVTIVILSLAFHFEAVLAGSLLLYAATGPVVGLVRTVRGRSPIPEPPVPELADVEDES